jgi:hypothetical protein
MDPTILDLQPHLCVAETRAPVTGRRIGTLPTQLAATAPGTASSSWALRARC